MTSRERRYIGAHELGQFVYCPRVWWSESQGLPGDFEGSTGPSARERGKRVHAEMEARHVRAQYAARAPYVAAAVLGLLLLTGISLWWFHLFPW